DAIVNSGFLRNGSDGFNKIRHLFNVADNKVPQQMACLVIRQFDSAVEMAGAFLKQVQKSCALLIMFSGVGDKVANLTHRVNTHGFLNLTILSEWVTAELISFPGKLGRRTQH